MVPVGRTATVRVPATSANLGPGFDACGLALAWYDELTVTVIDAGVRVEVTGEGADGLPTDERHLVVRTVRHGLEQLGAGAAGLHLVAHNTIPHGRGLGSSAAALVAGLALAWQLARPQHPVDLAWLVATAAALEGHPDNVAAAALGGYTIAWTPGPAEGAGAAGVARALSLPVADGVTALLLVPDDALPTSDARGALPERVPHVDAARNAGRAALLTHAITSAPELLPAATLDWLHQHARAARMPTSYQLVERLRADGHAAMISGAGPAVLVLGERSALELVAGSAPAGFRARVLAVGSGVEAVRGVS